MYLHASYSVEDSCYLLFMLRICYLIIGLCVMFVIVGKLHRVKLVWRPDAYIAGTTHPAVKQKAGSGSTMLNSPVPHNNLVETTLNTPESNNLVGNSSLK